MATDLSRTETKSAMDKIERQSPYIRAVTAKAIAEDSIVKVTLGHFPDCQSGVEGFRIFTE